MTALPEMHISDGPYNGGSQPEVDSIIDIFSRGFLYPTRVIQVAAAYAHTHSAANLLVEGRPHAAVVIAAQEPVEIFVSPVAGLKRASPESFGQ